MIFREYTIDSLNVIKRIYDTRLNKFTSLKILMQDLPLFFIRGSVIARIG